mmetsp:Transcript_2801/g.7660  ORF Transcript_2801/g.7660 Transcript_2801/m.7660 type:complete len:268 (+) Transcript_2801:263-1066(+)
MSYSMDVRSSIMVGSLPDLFPSLCCCCVSLLADGNTPTVTAAMGLVTAMPASKSAKNAALRLAASSPPSPLTTSTCTAISLSAYSLRSTTAESVDLRTSACSSSRVVLRQADADKPARRPAPAKLDAFDAGRFERANPTCVTLAAIVPYARAPPNSTPPPAAAAAPPPPNTSPCATTSSAESAALNLLASLGPSTRAVHVVCPDVNEAWPSQRAKPQAPEAPSAGVSSSGAFAANDTRRRRSSMGRLPSPRRPSGLRSGDAMKSEVE